MYKKISGLVVSLTAVFACAAWAEVPAGYPADYQKTVDAAVKEGKVVIYSTTDTKAAGPLIKGFEAQYPGVKVEFSHRIRGTICLAGGEAITRLGGLAAKSLWHYL